MELIKIVSNTSYQQQSMPQAYAPYHSDSFHSIEFKKDQPSRPKIQLIRTGKIGNKVVQCIKEKYVYSYTNDKNRKVEIGVDAKTLFQILVDSSNTAAFGGDNPNQNDWYTNFKNFTENDERTKIILNGTAFRRADRFSPTEQVNYIYYKNGTDAQEISSYPDLANEVKTRKPPSVSGKEQARDIRNYIKSGITTDTWDDDDDMNATTTPRDYDSTLKQITLALFGSETTRVPRAFITNMMLLDNM